VQAREHRGKLRGISTVTPRASTSVLRGGPCGYIRTSAYTPTQIASIVAAPTALLLIALDFLLHFAPALLRLLGLPEHACVRGLGHDERRGGGRRGYGRKRKREGYGRTASCRSRRICSTRARFSPGDSATPNLPHPATNNHGKVPRHTRIGHTV
jgi:hypothetical protein